MFAPPLPPPRRTRQPQPRGAGFSGESPERKPLEDQLSGQLRNSWSEGRHRRRPSFPYLSPWSPALVPSGKPLRGLSDTAGFGQGSELSRGTGLTSVLFPSPPQAGVDLEPVTPCLWLVDLHL
ncbi:unnamed protein product [Coccothraustes coccothraustes]